MDLTGTSIGQYHVIEQLGHGGMATVYKARQPSLDRYVAIKVLKADLAHAEGFVARFEREARTIARLRHRNILTIFDYGHEQDLFYLVMEYVGGGTLKERLGWPQDLGYAVNMISQMGNALAHAHRLGMIHRDVKPANILLVEEDWPLLSDFGLAKMVQDTLQLTMSGASVGTPQYMSPEQAQSFPVDQRSDIYSLGVVLYEAVTGQPPFGLDSPMAVVLKHISDPVTPPCKLRSDLPNEIERVILKALAKDPANRYQRMEDFVTDLQKAANLNLLQPGGMPISPRDPPLNYEPVSTPSTPSRRLRQRKSRWVKVVMRFLLLVGFGLIALLLFRDSLLPLVAPLIEETASTMSADLLAGVITPSAAEATPLETLPVPTATEPEAITTDPPPTATFLPSPELTPTPMPTATALAPLPTPTPPATPTAPPQPTVQTQIWPADGAEMVFVPAGGFLMGSNDLGDDERPIHPVYLDDFWLDRYEVTNERFARFVDATAYQTEAEQAGWGWVRIGDEWEEVSGADWRHPRGPNSNIEGLMDHPAVLMSWNDADAYCDWAGKQLPTEAQWEKAARGPAGYAYAWGNEFDSTKANIKETGLNNTTPVGAFSPQGDSAYGAADITGNVWEWVADWYGSAYYSQSPSANPPGPDSGAYKVLRGGSWLFDSVYARTAFRYNVRPDYTYDFTGFRCSR
ncbi:MAG: SUMF1/EgtB/PvdO family nonheme iron enzyme [Anaerolineae bacterium]|nr:SUMF1/EgtB/PvdO family nonheme iron enzyme [Anaerolineae bacterium]